MANIYNFESSLQKLLIRISGLDADAEPLKKWYLHLKTDKTECLGIMRIVKMLGNAAICSERLKLKYGKRITEAGKEEIKELIIWINDSDKAELTKRDYRIAVKKFLIFIGKPDFVDWIQTSAKKCKRKLPSDMLTEEELEMVIAKAINPRDKALFALLGDSGLRIGEALGLRIKDLNFDDYGAFLVIQDGKTGARRVRLISSIHYMKNWIETHPKPDRDNYIFVTLNKNAGILKHHAARKGLIEAAKAAGITKRIHPHLFRHAAATRAAGFLTESEMKVHFGWTGNSDMASVYVHLSGEQVDNKMLSHFGLKKEESNGKETHIKCPKCSKLNPKTARFCLNCSCILDVKLMSQSETTQSQVVKVREYLFQSKEFEALLAKALSMSI